METSEQAEGVRRLLVDLRDLDPMWLAHIAEQLGAALCRRCAVPVLLALLDHAEPVVREGAALGLAAGHLEAPGVLDALRHRLVLDTSSGVRAAIMDLVPPVPRHAPHRARRIAPTPLVDQQR